MSRRKHSTNAERRARARRKRLDRDQENRHEECRQLAAQLPVEWRERELDNETLSPDDAETGDGVADAG